MSWAWDFWWLRKTRTDTQTDPQDSCFISIDSKGYRVHDITSEKCKDEVCFQYDKIRIFSLQYTREIENPVYFVCNNNNSTYGWFGMLRKTYDISGEQITGVTLPYQTSYKTPALPGDLHQKCVNSVRVSFRRHFYDFCRGEILS